MATVSDDFNYPDGTLASLNPTGWQVVNYPAADIPVVSGELFANGNPLNFTPAGSANHTACIRTETFDDDQWGQIEFGSQSFDSSGFLGILLRSDGAGNGYLGCWFNGDFNIYRLDSGVSNMLQSHTVAGTPPPGSVLKFGVVGSDFTLYGGGVSMVTATDTTYTSGSVGLMLYPTSSGDNFEAADTVTPPPPPPPAAQFPVFFDVVPPFPLAATAAWTSVTVLASTSETGTFTSILNQTLSPTDADPMHPAQRQFVAANTFAGGWYKLMWTNAAGGTMTGDAIRDQGVVVSNLRPTADQVALLMPHRTVAAGTGGNETGAFSTTTRPTLAQVQSIIDIAVRNVRLAIGGVGAVPPSTVPQCQDAALYLSCALIELTFFKNEIEQQISTYPMWDSLYKDAVQAIEDEITGQAAGSDLPGIWTYPTRRHRDDIYSPGRHFNDYYS